MSRSGWRDRRRCRELNELVLSGARDDLAFLIRKRDALNKSIREQVETINRFHASIRKEEEGWQMGRK